MKSIRMRGTGHVARMAKTRNAYKILVGIPNGRHSGVDGRILKWILTE
jgi:hypothetical protein